MMCWNKKTLGILAVAALAVLAVAPSAFGRAAPLLIMLACPLGMLFMVRGARGACRPGAAEPGGQGATTSPDATEAELVRLRQEVDRLRAADPQPGPAPSEGRD